MYVNIHIWMSGLSIPVMRLRPRPGSKEWVESWVCGSLLTQRRWVWNVRHLSAQLLSSNVHTKAKWENLTKHLLHIAAINRKDLKLCLGIEIVIYVLMRLHGHHACIISLHRGCHAFASVQNFTPPSSWCWSVTVAECCTVKAVLVR